LEIGIVTGDNVAHGIRQWLASGTSIDSATRIRDQEAIAKGAFQV
jgi:hypothetical protein